MNNIISFSMILGNYKLSPSLTKLNNLYPYKVSKSPFSLFFPCMLSQEKMDVIYEQASHSSARTLTWAAVGSEAAELVDD